MITTNTYELITADTLPSQDPSPSDKRPACASPDAQVSLLTLMVGNLDEKSLALAAILTATWRATAL